MQKNNNTVLKIITVMISETKTDTLYLPQDCIHWEIYSQTGSYQPVKFLAIRKDGSIGKIVEYGSGRWIKYDAS